HRPLDLGRRWHVGLAREHLAPVLRCVHNQAAVPVVPVRRLLAIGVVLGTDLLAVRLGVHPQVERVFRAPGPDPAAGPWRPLRDAGLVVARPVMATGPQLALVAGEDRDHRRAASVGRPVEPVLYTFTGVDR